MTERLDHDVVIVGGGPTGATLGLLLARGGVDALIIDKEADIYPLPRAAHIDHEIVRIFQDLGLADSLSKTWRSSPRYDFLNAQGDVLLRFEGMDKLGPGGWPASNMIHQPSLESLIRDAIADERNVSLETRWAYQSHLQKDDHVEIEISTPDGLLKRRAAFMVGADGARSPVREAAGIVFDDLNFDEPWLVIDTIVHDASRLPDVNLQICDPERPTTCVLMGEGRHRWEFMIKPGETPEQVLDDDFVASLLRPWHVDGAVTLERKAVYRFNARVAKQWRQQRLILAGDAAHQMPPFAGQGLCSGLRDAANLAWKLAAIRSGASEDLLDSYQPEREPNVRAIIAMAMMMGQTVCLTDSEAARQRDASMLAQRASGKAPDGKVSYPDIESGCILAETPGAGSYFPQPVSEAAGTVRFDDVMGAGAWLISRSEPRAPEDKKAGLRSLTLDDPAIRPFHDILDKWLASHAVEAVLVRPDHYVFGSGQPASLREQWRCVVT